jgi:hypothetical protein
MIQSVSVSYGSTVDGQRNMDRSAFASSGRKVYRFNRIYRWYHFIVGGLVLAGAVAAHDFLALSIVLALFSGFMILRPLVVAVIVDQYSVTLKGMLSKHSLQRSSITAIETVGTGKGPMLILRGNIEGKESLAIGVNLFAFDEAWDEWLSTYRDLSDDKPLSLFPPGWQ